MPNRSLETGARLNASHLEPAEIEALSRTGLDHAHLQQLGLAGAGDQAAHKLAARRASAPGAAAAPLSDLVLADDTAWMTSASAVEVADLAMDLRAGRRLRIVHRRSGTHQSSSVVVDPYGLAVKVGRWYLVADTDGIARLFTVERLSACEVLLEPVRWRAGPSLRAVWTQLREHVDQVGSIEVQARLRRSRVDLARRVLGSRMTRSTTWTTSGAT